MICIIAALQTCKMFRFVCQCLWETCPQFWLFILMKIYDPCVLNRLLAMRGLQRITTPVVLGNSFSSTIWRAVSSEGRVSCFYLYLLYSFSWFSRRVPHNPQFILVSVFYITVHFSPFSEGSHIKEAQVLLTFLTCVFLAGQLLRSTC